MKNKYLIVLLTSVFILILGACSDDKSNDAGETEDSDTTNNEDQVDSNEENGSSENDDVFKIETEDQLDLVVGDTGHFDTTLGTYDVTLDAAELIGPELDGIETQLDDLILLDLTIKNTSDHNLDIDDLLIAMEVTEDLEGSGYKNSTGSFDSLEEFIGILKPGEEKSGQFITEAYESDQHYFRKDSGNVAAGGSNQVIWTIEADESR